MKTKIYIKAAGILLFFFCVGYMYTEYSSIYQWQPEAVRIAAGKKPEQFLVMDEIFSETIHKTENLPQFFTDDFLDNLKQYYTQNRLLRNEQENARFALLREFCHLNSRIITLVPGFLAEGEHVKNLFYNSSESDTDLSFDTPLEKIIMISDTLLAGCLLSLSYHPAQAVERFSKAFSLCCYLQQSEKYTNSAVQILSAQNRVLSVFFKMFPENMLSSDRELLKEKLNSFEYAEMSMQDFSQRIKKRISRQSDYVKTHALILYHMYYKNMFKICSGFLYDDFYSEQNFAALKKADEASLNVKYHIFDIYCSLLWRKRTIAALSALCRITDFVEVYKRFPKDEAELYKNAPVIDSYTGKPFSFRVEKDTLILYSVGTDNIKIEQILYTMRGNYGEYTE